MFFFTPPTIAVMQTGLPIAAGMQSMKLPTTVANSQRIGFRAERERDGRGDHDDESYITDSRPGARFGSARPFGLPRAKDAREGDTRHGP
jgi:hypothetical protein